MCVQEGPKRESDFAAEEAPSGTKRKLDQQPAPSQPAEQALGRFLTGQAQSKTHFQDLLQYCNFIACSLNASHLTGGSRAASQPLAAPLQPAGSSAPGTSSHASGQLSGQPVGSQGTTQLQGQGGKTDPQTSGVDADQPAAAAGEQVSTSDIQRVQNYIERCLQMYLSQKEVMRLMKGALHA